MQTQANYSRITLPYLHLCGPLACLLFNQDIQQMSRHPFICAHQFSYGLVTYKYNTKQQTDNLKTLIRSNQTVHTEITQPTTAETATKGVTSTRTNTPSHLTVYNKIICLCSCNRKMSTKGHTHGHFLLKLSEFQAEDYKSGLRNRMCR